MIDEAAFEARLTKRRAELLELERISAAARAPVALDQQSVGRLSRMDAMQQQAMARAEGRRRKIELQRTEVALVRLGEGEYGYCIACGEVIARRRLENDPSVARCIACAS